jgi:hypothetical protein
MPHIHTPAERAGLASERDDAGGISAVVGGHSLGLRLHPRGPFCGRAAASAACCYPARPPLVCQAMIARCRKPGFVYNLNLR